MNSQHNSELPASSASDESLIQPVEFTPHNAASDRRHWRPSRKQWLIGIPLATGLCLVLLLMLSRSVSFITLPANSAITVDSPASIKLADTWLLFPGQYQVSARHPGYYPLETQIEVTRDAEQQFTLELKKLPGRLAISLSDPNIIADVLIDGDKRGTTAAEIADLPPGQHSLSLVHPRYLTHEQNLVIEGLDQLQHLELTLQPAWADVSISTEPPGATLSVADQVLGQTPGTFQILQGEQQLSLALPGHKLWQDLFEFQAGEKLTLPAIKLAKADGVINLSTRPSGASVTVNGSFLGETPVALSLAPGRDHVIKVFKDGYQDLQTRRAIASGDQQDLMLALQPALGKINISTDVSDAELYVDGRLMGRPNQILELPARPHKIEVKKSGYQTFEAEVTPRPALGQKLSVKLRTLDQAKWDKIPQQITTATGQHLTLFKPNARFTMGSSRREQGRRSNESLRQVALTRPFYVSPLLVTNADFVQFERFHSSSHVNGNSLFGNEQPVVNVTWDQAARFCNWLSEKAKLPPFYQETDGNITGFNPDATGYRLLTEAEWSWLARVQDNDGLRKYPWGNQMPPPTGAGNYGDRSAAALLGLIILDYQDGYPVTSPVGKFAPNDKGLYDMGGNASEWINDFYGVGTGLNMKTETDPLGPEKGDYHVIRGSSWAHGGITELRMAYRDYGAEKRNDVGFRIARFVEPRKE
ncbi:PEGA domain-containing protein [Simiduia agarivorans]|uniref:PEGA domain-containing protein n=1 Tax=Simiduia agarivorans (strain DSM 21679 / JCM 13881 / BCRC 17597 / SA1) TaxID=1117647 RepID=K4KW19_SIMAS|nr:PEGA domain-containing protein [Simiduia agarivorans]AFU98127.1 hypothetical protein M5M_04600 [Simiduia agarivorans SA1 = DSM 21679]